MWTFITHTNRYINIPYVHVYEVFRERCLLFCIKLLYWKKNLLIWVLFPEIPSVFRVRSGVVSAQTLLFRCFRISFQNLSGELLQGLRSSFSPFSDSLLSQTFLSDPGAVASFPWVDVSDLDRLPPPPLPGVVASAAWPLVFNFVAHICCVVTYRHLRPGSSDTG